MGDHQCELTHHRPTPMICAMNSENSLEKLDESIFGKWRHYLQLKAQFYLAYAYAFLGESLLTEDKCGEAIRACKEGISYYQVAADFAVKYAKASGPGK